MYKLLSVDDEPINQAIVEELFSAQFNITLAESGEECLTVIEPLMPDLILLDVSMAGMDGYTTCTALKKNAQAHNIPVFFVSARGTLDDKLKAYDVGGYDFITKPFNHAELGIKINHTIEAIRQLPPTDSLLTKPAVTSTALDDSKLLIEFINHCAKATSLNSLGKILLNAGKNLRLDCLVQFQIASASYPISAIEHLLPLEKALLEDPCETDTILEFNTRLLLRRPHISMLIKNMPVTDKTRCEKIKDILEALITGTEAKINALLCESAR